MYVLLFVMYSVRNVYGPFDTQTAAEDKCAVLIDNYDAAHPRADRSLYSILPLEE